MSGARGPASRQWQAVLAVRGSPNQSQMVPAYIVRRFAEGIAVTGNCDSGGDSISVATQWLAHRLKTPALSGLARASSVLGGAVPKTGHAARSNGRRGFSTCGDQNVAPFNCGDHPC